MAKIFLNPGHDQLDLEGTPDYDPGAVNKELGLYENEIAADIGELVAHYLKEAGCEVESLQNERLSYICAMANRSGAELFVSIHCNAFNGAANGTESLFYPGDAEGKRLAECINRQIVDTFDITDRGVKERGDLAVLNGTYMPAVLVETAFIDNEDDAIILRDQQDEMARAIARGVTDYLTEE
jgi:N-acetylmuramoyl-L-alanine amidase